MTIHPSGWVHLWRSSDGHPDVWQRGPLCWQIWCLCLMRANGLPKTLKDGTTVPRGSFVTSYPELRHACRYRYGRGWRYPALSSVKQQVSYLVSRQCLGRKADRDGLLITVINYDAYNPPANEKSADSWAEGPLKDFGQQSPTKKVKKEKEGKDMPSSESPASVLGGASDGNGKVKTVDVVDGVYEVYKQRVNAKSRLTPTARKKVEARLKSYTLEDLFQAMQNFSGDGWWMDNNAHRGVAWFFYNDDRIDQFINLVPDRERATDPLSDPPEEWEPAWS